MKAAETLLAIKVLTKKGRQKTTRCPQSKLTAIRYDMRSYSLWLDRSEVSLLTLEGRKTFQFQVADYYKQYTSWKHKSADLKIYGKRITLNVVFETELSDIPVNGNVVGLDRGQNNLAVLSTGKLTLIIRLQSK